LKYPLDILVRFPYLPPPPAVTGPDLSSEQIPKTTRDSSLKVTLEAARKKKA